jgi:ABC-type nitrate/sulfonate/bicarbonate transport system permease component
MRDGRRWLVTGVTAVAIVGLWQLYGTVWSVVPAPTGIISALRRDWDLYPDNITATLSGATKGWVAGNLVGMVLAACSALVPITENYILRFGVAIYSLPVVAIGAILQIAFSADTATVIVAALACYFTTLVGLTAGFRSADRSAIDLVRALGGSTFDTVAKVRVKAALPSFFNALKISAPAAVLGAAIAEFLGRADKGLGLFMVSSMSQLDHERTWGIAAVLTALAGAGFGLIALVGRLVTPWAPRDGQAR